MKVKKQDTPRNDKAAPKGPSKTGAQSAPPLRCFTLPAAARIGAQFFGFTFRVMGHTRAGAEETLKTRLDALDTATREAARKPLEAKIAALADDLGAAERRLFKANSELAEARRENASLLETLRGEQRTIGDKTARINELFDQLTAARTALDEVCRRVSCHAANAAETRRNLLAGDRLNEAETCRRIEAEETAADLKVELADAKADVSFARARGKDEGRAEVANTFGDLAETMFGVPAGEVAAAVLTATTAAQEAAK